MFKDEDNIIYLSQNKETLEKDYKSGIALDPSNDYELKFADLHSSDSGRSWLTGNLDIIILRQNVLSTDLVFNAIEQSEFVKILDAIKVNADGGFYASIFMDDINARKIFHMYRSDRSYTRHRYVGGWRYDLSISIIEM